MTIDGKDKLLKSGLPLEASVRKIIQELKFKEPYEYNFLRKNIDGITNNFSVDFLASKSISIENNNNYFIHYLIECKYCSPETKWIFTPNNYEILDKSSLIMDTYDSKNRLNIEYWDEFYKYPLVNKGTVLNSKNANQTQIKDAFHQLGYAYISNLFEYLNWDNNNTIFIIPIVVTTAELWRINDNATIENIEKCKNIEDICSMSNILLYQSYPDNLMKRYYLEKYNNLDPKIKHKVILNHARNYSGETIEEYIDAASEYDPNTFFVINYQSFKSEFTRIDKYFSDKAILEKRHENIKI